MKWFNSIITKITIIFVLAIFGVGAILFATGSHYKDKEVRSAHKFAEAIISSNFHKNNKQLDIEKLENSGFIEIKNNKIKEVIKNKLEKQHKMKNIKSKRFFKYERQGGRFKKNNHRDRKDYYGGEHNKELDIDTLLYKKLSYVVINHSNHDFHVFKIPMEKDSFPKIIFPILAVIFLFSLYIAIIRSIIPLYDLKKKVQEFADGNYDINCQSKKKDEIALLSNEFDKSVKKIKKLRDSRQLFLRNIMHELKTPITKGKLSCEMIEDSAYQTTLKKVFRRQEILLEEFSRIEKLSANELNITKQEYSLQDIIDFSLDILNHDKKSVTCKLNPMVINVDFELFATAIKNLLDNGINYSDNLHVDIESIDNKIIISNTGKELEFPLERYSEPYFLEGKKQKSSRGLGFGLFITINLIKLHDMKILYNRDENKNIFIIEV